MEIELLTVGKTQTKLIIELINVYLKRLKHYIPYRIKELADVKNSGRLSQEERKQMEGNMILSSVENSDIVILLDERGKMPTSREFSRDLQKLMVAGHRRVVFVVGGPYGFSEDVYNRANQLLSLSKMTFSHEMVRLFFTEQLYRAMTILRGEPYHHD